MYSIEILMYSILLLLANTVQADIENDGAPIASSAGLATKSIKDAELAGADLSDLVKGFNTALDLINQADRSKFDSCSSHEDCHQKAMMIFMKITADAHLLKERAEASSSLQKLVSLTIYAPITAFVTSLVGYSSYKAWKDLQLKKFLRMEVRIKEE